MTLLEVQADLLEQVMDLPWYKELGYYALLWATSSLMLLVSLAVVPFHLIDLILRPHNPH